MKYIKSYENIQEEPQVGDYIIMHTITIEPNAFKFINNNIGQILTIEPGLSQNKKLLSIAYDNVPAEITEWFNWDSFIMKYVKRFSDRFIVAFSKNKEDLEHIIDAKKYNL